MQLKRLDRRSVITGAALVAGSTIALRNISPLRAQPVDLQWVVLGADDLGLRVSSCAELRAFAAHTDAKASRLEANQGGDLAEYQRQLRDARSALDRQIERVSVDSANANVASTFAYLGGAVALVTTSIGVAAIVAPAAVSAVVIGAATGVSIVAGPALFTMQMVMTKRADAQQEATSGFLMAHAADRAGFLAAEVGRGVVRIAGNAFGFASAFYGTYQGFVEGAAAGTLNSRLTYLKAEMRSLSADLRQLEQNPQAFRNTKILILRNIAAALRTRAAEGTATNCRLALTPITMPSSAPALRLP